MNSINQVSQQMLESNFPLSNPDPDLARKDAEVVTILPVEVSREYIKL